ncbi:hypothetical protein Tco_1465700 [Tanacetum coccineum]
MLERLTQQTVDPLALMSNVSPQHYHSQSSTIPPTTYHQPHSADTSQSDLGLSPTDNLIENLTNTLGRQNRGQGNNAQGTGATGYGGAHNRVGNANPGQARQVLAEEQLFVPNWWTGPHAIDEDVDEQPVPDLALMWISTNYVQANLSSVDSVAIGEHLRNLGMQDDVQPSYVVGSHADYTSDSNMTPYDQYVKDNAVPVVQNNASTVPNDMYVMIDNDLHEPKAQSVFKAPTYIVADNSLNAELVAIGLQEPHMSKCARQVTACPVLWTLDFQITQLTKKINVLQEQNEFFGAENGKIKQHYKELYDSIKITRAKHLEQTTALLTENESLKNNREVHLVCLKHLKESVETHCEIGEEAKAERPLDRSLASACRYTKHSQELLEYVIDTCPKALNTRDNKHASTSLPKKKQVTFEEQCAMSKSNTHKPVEQLNCQKTNVPVPPSTGVNSCTDASGSQPRSNTKKNRILPAKSVNMKKVEEHPKTIKSSLKTMNRVDSSISSKRTVINLNSHSVCQTCNKCLISANHDMCVVTYLHSVNASPSVKNVVRKVKQVWKPKQVKQVWKPTGNILTTVGYQWMPTGRTFTLGEQCPLTRLTKPNKVSAIAYANPREPNHNWGSNFPNSPS